MGKSQCVGFIAGADCVSFGDVGNYCASGCDHDCLEDYECEMKMHLDGMFGDYCVFVGGVVVLFVGMQWSPDVLFRCVFVLHS